MTQERMPKQLNYQNIYEIFSRFREHEAEPKGELDHVNAFTLVVAVALSAQSTDLGVNKATKKLFAIADTPEKMIALGLNGVMEHIKTIGLYRQKAKNVINKAVKNRLCCGSVKAESINATTINI